MRSGTAQAINDVWTSLSVTGWIAHAGDPSEIVESGKRTGEMGKDMVGWGRWDSAPGQTAGSLIPDVVGAVVSGGTLPAARGAGRAASRYARWSALANPIPVDRLASAARVLADSAASRTMADVADLGRWINDRWDGTKEAAARAGQRWQPATALAGGPSPSVAPTVDRSIILNQEGSDKVNSAIATIFNECGRTTVWPASHFSIDRIVTEVRYFADALWA